MNRTLQLDDLTYADLVAEARALVPSLAPGWTDHNPSDPGIVLVELFAWLVEMVIYRLARVPDENYRQFLRLLNGPGWHEPDWSQPNALDEAIRATLSELRTPYRAVTQQDFETIVLKQLPQGTMKPPVGRVRCLPERNVEGTPSTAPAPGHVSLVVLRADGSNPSPTELAAVKAFLEPRRLVTTKLHVVAPRRVTVQVSASLYLEPGAVPDDVASLVGKRLASFLDVFDGGPDGTGWPFGRPLYTSDLVTLFMKDIPGIAAVKTLTITAPGVTLLEGGTTLDVSDYEVVTAAAPTLTMFSRQGITWLQI